MRLYCRQTLIRSTAFDLLQEQLDKNMFPAVQATITVKCLQRKQ